MQFEARRPAQTAREMLGEALGKIQDIRDDAMDTEAVTASIARAVGALFAVQSSDPSEPAHVAGVCQAMDHLRETLRAMQEVRGEDPALAHATRVIAKTLAMLYPVSKVQERQSIQVDRPPSMVGAPLPEDARRSVQRIAIEADIGFQSDTNFFTGFTEDISTGGLFVATFDARPLGDELTLSFTLPNGHLVTVAGIVRWVREYNETTPDVEPGMGVQFRQLDPEDEAQINRFLEQREPMFFEG